jgi:transglutaminase-like putative cysteine protease
MKENLEAIGYPLPEDIEKLKWYGDFDGCLRLIDRRLQENIPDTLAQKLRMEKVQINRMRRDYVVTAEEANRILDEKLQDWDPAQLDQLRQENVIDWAFVNGEIRYIDSFFSNLMKIRSDLAARQKHPENTHQRTEPEIRDEIVAGMKAHGGVTCKLTISAHVTVQPSQGAGERARIWVPYPAEDLQIQNAKIQSITPNGTPSPKDAAQPTVYFEVPTDRETRAEVVYSLENHMTYVQPDPEKVSPEQPDFYTQEQLPHIAFTPYLRALTAEILDGETNPLKKARKIYDFVTQKVVYSYMRGYISLPCIPEYCASRLRGDCGVQALTFITLCRIAGVPARWQSGLYANENGAGCHDWAMFYVAPYGWMWADCSFGGAAWRDGAMDRWNFYFGNMDPYRIVLAREFQHEFSPEPKFLRSDPYDNQIGEAEGSEAPYDRNKWQGDADIVSLELQWDQDYA